MLYIYIFFWFKQVLDQGPEQRESKLTILCPLIIAILISYIIIYYIIIKLLIIEDHPQPKPEMELSIYLLLLNLTINPTAHSKLATLYKQNKINHVYLNDLAYHNSWLKISKGSLWLGGNVK